MTQFLAFDLAFFAAGSHAKPAPVSAFATSTVVEPASISAGEIGR
jgi:hypothetical protein